MDAICGQDPLEQASGQWSQDGLVSFSRAHAALSLAREFLRRQRAGLSPELSISLH